MSAYFAKLFRSPQTGRVARLMLFTLISAAVSVPLVQSWEVRYPLLGGLIGFLEAMYRTAVPTQPAPFVTSQPARPTETAPPKE
jgi:hypothetical protein